VLIFVLFVFSLFSLTKINSNLLGLSDPWVNIKIVSNKDTSDDTSSTVAKVRSKVIKQNLNPQWNETLTVSLTNAQKEECRVHAYVKDWNRIGHSKAMGDAFIYNLADLKNAQQDLWVNLQK
jgi:Ca2+-dependent lipid-binding protein